MSILRFGGDRELSIKIRPPESLFKGVGINRLTFPVEMDTRNSPLSGGVPITLAGEAWLGMNNADWLGRWHSDGPVTTTEGVQFDCAIVLPLTDEQLSVLEQRRAGADLQFRIHVWASLGYDPNVAQGDQTERWPSQQLQELVTLQSGAWTRLLSQASAGTSLAIVMPVPLHGGDEALTKAGAYLREAISKINAGAYDDAVVRARKALDALDLSLPKAKAVVEVDARLRSLDQRLGLLYDSLHSLASLAPHGDELASTVQWTRERALAVIAGVAALAAWAG
jgi:hypothetical protein